MPNWVKPGLLVILKSMTNKTEEQEVLNVVCKPLSWL